MENPPEISQRTSSKSALPNRYTYLMSSRSREPLDRANTRAVSAATDMSAMSMESTVSDFLEKRARVLESEFGYCRAYQAGLRDARSTEQLSNDDYQNELDELDVIYEPKAKELQVLKKQRRTLKQDVEEDCGKRQKIALEPSVEFLERVYTAIVVSRVMASSKQGKSRFNQSAFRKEVVSYLNAGSDPTGGEGVWCHLSGWHHRKDVKAAHLVPKSLRGDELTFLFGVGEVVLSDPRNGLTLHHVLEEGLDSGTIAIVPIPPTDQQPETKWKCILVDETSRNKMTMSGGGFIQRWKDFDGKELEFRSDNRPARRYLYFRFITTYLHAKRSGNLDWAKKVESRKVLWASPGPYLEKSTLLSLGRNISGLELPPPLYEGNTFDSEEPEKGEPEDLILASRLRIAMVESAKDKSEEDSDELDTSDEDDI